MASEPTHHVGLGIMRGGAFVGVTAVGFNINPEPRDNADVRALGERITARAREAGDLQPGMHYVVLSWQRFGGERRGKH